MNRRSPFLRRFLYLVGILLGLAGCVSPRLSPSPAPAPLPPSPPPPAVRLHARAGIDQPPSSQVTETGPFRIESLPIAEAKLLGLTQLNKL